MPHSIDFFFSFSKQSPERLYANQIGSLILSSSSPSPKTGFLASGAFSTATNTIGFLPWLELWAKVAGIFVKFSLSLRPFPPIDLWIRGVSIGFICLSWSPSAETAKNLPFYSADHGAQPPSYPPSRNDFQWATN
ncbi:hypothetical protein M9H77_13293 [Catharanthus roseus]|uniref:Uncharacterized protein n=1 Tax=Catharanthus roseus TaxID=4058 RepID=A0ACC0BJW6_CATRO|nr:hypothetical protein M9H77_13293 [Catharanthus roseus]